MYKMKEKTRKMKIENRYKTSIERKERRRRRKRKKRRKFNERKNIPIQEKTGLKNEGETQPYVNYI